MKLQVKIVLALAVLLTLSGTASILYLKLRFTGQLRGELEKRGISIARNLAHHSTSSLLAHDRLALKMIAVAQARNEADIVYIFFVDARGDTVLAHTLGEDFPRGLLAANAVPTGNGFSVRNLETELGAIYDIAMPVEGGGLGAVRVGLSAAPVRRAIDDLSGEMLLATVLFGVATLLLSLPLSASITRPIKTLIVTAEAVASGDLEQQVPVTTRDEIGQLGRTFNRMTARLQEARRELLARNTELGAEVTLRRDAETRLAAQLSLLSTLMEEIPTPIFFKDPEGIYRGCNRAFEVFTGIPRDELCGQTVSTLYPAGEAHAHAEADANLLARRGSCSYESTFTTRQGGKREVIVQKATYNTPTGELAGMVGILVDVTREREVDRLRDDFVSITAHEFQTPLTAIIGFCDLLLADDTIAPEARREYLDIIRERSEFLSSLIDRFLDVSRIDSGRAIPLEPRSCQVDQLLRRILRNYQIKDSHHRFELLLPAHPPAIHLDELRFSQVLENLLGNAIKYSPAGSLIRLRAEVGARHFVITVADQGPGMTEEQRSRIFDKFYRIDSSNQAPSGTGLGLYISRAIVAAHGGSLDVTAPADGGSCFIITLPLATTDNQD